MSIGGIPGLSTVSPEPGTWGAPSSSLLAASLRGLGSQDPLYKGRMGLTSKAGSSV